MTSTRLWCALATLSGRSDAPGDELLAGCQDEAREAPKGLWED